MTSVLSVDFGQAQDYTAFSVIERQGIPPEELFGPSVKPRLNLRHLERPQLGTKYPRILDRIKGLLGDARLQGVELIVDATGVGRPLVDQLDEMGMRPIAVVVTGSGQAHREGRFWHVPKRDLVMALALALQNDRLRIARHLALGEAMVQEAAKFKAKISAAGHASFEAWRESDHDDLVFSVAMGVWWAERGAGVDCFS